MSTESSTAGQARTPAVDKALYAMFGVVAASAFALAFTHMHDWTIESLDDALRAAGSDARTPQWGGWANAVISEILPVASFLLFRKRQREERPTRVPMMVFIGSAAVSMLAQLSATGRNFPLAADFLACLPALALIVLAKLIFADMEYGHKARIAAVAEAERSAERRANVRRAEAERRAELDRVAAAQSAKLAAELKRAETEHAADLERQRIAAEADAAARCAEIEAAAVTERIRIEAAERAAEREARERAAEREAAARHAAEVERARVAAEAEAQRVMAEAEAKRQAAALLAAQVAEREADAGAAGDAGRAAGRQRRAAAETAALVGAVLTGLPAGADRTAAIAAVVQQLGVSRQYAGRLVPEGFTGGGGAPGFTAGFAAGSYAAGDEGSSRPRLTVVGAG